MAAAIMQNMLAGIESRLSPALNELQRRCVLKIHGYIQAQPVIDGKRSIERAKIRDAPGLHKDRKTKTGEEIINSRLGVISPRTGLVGHLHQRTDADASVIQVDSDLTASDLGFTEKEWIWLCIPGAYNPWLDVTGKVTQKKRKAPAEDEDANEDISRIGLPTPPSTGRRTKRRKFVPIDESDEDTVYVNDISELEDELEDDDHQTIRASLEREDSAISIASTVASNKHPRLSTYSPRSRKRSRTPYYDNGGYTVETNHFLDYHQDNDHGYTLNTTDDNYHNYPSYISQDKPPFQYAGPFLHNIANDNYSGPDTTPTEDHPSLIEDIPDETVRFPEPGHFLAYGVAQQSHLPPEPNLFTGSPPNFSIPSPHFNDPGIWPEYAAKTPRLDTTASVIPAHLDGDPYWHDEEEQRARHLASIGLKPAPVASWKEPSIPKPLPFQNPFATFASTVPPPATYTTMPQDPTTLAPDLEITITRTVPEHGTLTASPSGEDVLTEISAPSPPPEHSGLEPFPDYNEDLIDFGYEDGVASIEDYYGNGGDASSPLDFGLNWEEICGKKGEKEGGNGEGEKGEGEGEVHPAL